MRKYLELFKEGFPSDMSDKTAIENWPYVGHDVLSGEVVYTVVPAKEEPITWDPYVTFTAEEDNSSIGLSVLSTNQTLEYSTDTTTWNTFDTATNISLNNGDKVYMRGILSGDNTGEDYTRFKISGKIVASGNCNALWNYEDLNAPLKAYCGYYMFYNNPSLTAVPELPATELAEYCYGYMFYECTSLVTAQKILPATTLASRCYSSMFERCTSLTTTPELPATELAEYCYNSMFMQCITLTTAPELPATTMTPYCYRGMFHKCTSLTTTPELPATELAEYCYNSMFRFCTSLTTALELPATELADYCYNSMFNGCTSLTAAPKLPATTLASNCYKNMFEGCTSLTTVVLPAITLVPYCYYAMLSGCTSLNNITCLASDISPNYCTSYWTSNVPSTGTFVKHPDMKDWTTGRNGIPSNWTVVDAEI